MVLTDGDGGTSNTASKTVTIDAAPDLHHRPGKQRNRRGHRRQCGDHL
ncbi:MAG: hypothetical protein R3F37_01535 [Candidatus Competibacteraceae bacterium]